MSGRVEFITKEIGVRTFHTGIFALRANLLSPVAVYARDEDQSLRAVSECMTEHSSEWMIYAGPAGIGQYSLRKREPAGLLARFDTYLRTPTEQEMKVDLRNLGEQVLGPEVASVPESERKKYGECGVVKISGKDYYFTGLPRIKKSVFFTRVFPGNIPSDISGLVEEVDRIAETRERIAPVGYQFLHAVDGNLAYLPFGRKEDFNPDRLNPYGHVSINHGVMLYSLDDSESPIDLTYAVYPGNLV